MMMGESREGADSTIPYIVSPLRRHQKLSEAGCEEQVTQTGESADLDHRLGSTRNHSMPARRAPIWRAMSAEMREEKINK